MPHLQTHAPLYSVTVYELVVFFTTNFSCGFDHEEICEKRKYKCMLTIRIFGKGEIKSYLGKVCIFLANIVLQKSQKQNVVMKNIINTIGKKTHSLVIIKKTHHSCYKIRQKCGFTLKVAFFCISLCFFLGRFCVSIGRELELCLQTHTYTKK